MCKEIQHQLNEWLGTTVYTFHDQTIYEQEENGIYEGRISYTFYPIHLTSEQIQEVEEGMNPTGAAVIDYSLVRKQFVSIIFVNDTSYARNLKIEQPTIEKVTKWISEKSLLIYEKEYVLQETDHRFYRFQPYYEGYPVLTSIPIQLVVDEDGRIINYQNTYQPPHKEHVHITPFVEDLEQIESAIYEQFHLIETPPFLEEEPYSFYGFDEAVFRATGEEVHHQLKGEFPVHALLTWKEQEEENSSPSTRFFFGTGRSEQEIVAQPLYRQPFVTKEEIKRCQDLVCSQLASTRSNESGVWQLKLLKPEGNYMHICCVLAEEKRPFFVPKIMLIIDRLKKKVVSMQDNTEMFPITPKFNTKSPLVTKREAFEQIINYLTVEPMYAYNRLLQRYELIGRLECSEGVDSQTGEVFSLLD